jgi:hypothetical protein
MVMVADPLSLIFDCCLLVCISQLAVIQRARGLCGGGWRGCSQGQRDALGVLQMGYRYLLNPVYRYLIKACASQSLPQLVSLARSAG